MNVMVQSLRELSQIKLAALVGTAVILISFFTFLALRISAPVMSPLYTNLPVEEGGAIIQELDTRGIDYEIRANGTQILVPSDDVLRLRMEMAQMGIPSSGSVVGYEIFDSSEALGTSNFVLNVNKLRALEGELARTVASFSKVDKARVHLVMPKRELFTRDRQEPTASVALKLRGGELSREEISSIRHLVATGVPGLKVQRITVVDSKGRLLAKGVNEEGDVQVFAEEAEEFRVGYENRLRSRLESLLEQTLGYGRVKVTVNADIDFDRIVRNSETFDPESQVARSVQGINEEERSNERNIDQNVTVENNLPDADADAAEGVLAQTEILRNEETTNFEISKEVTNHVKETGTVRRLSIAVVVDGTYLPAPEGVENPQPVYQPRSQNELEMIEETVQAAAGYDADRGDTITVQNMQFVDSGVDLFEEGPLDWIKNDMNSIIQTLVLGGVAILAILLVIRPLVNRAIESAEEAHEQEMLAREALEGPSAMGRLADLTNEDDEEEDLINIDRIQGQVKSSTYRKINDLIDKNPEETMGVIRLWQEEEV